MKKYTLLFCAALLLTYCAPEREDPFLVGKERVGKLQKTHRVSQLDSIYQLDSLVRDTASLSIGRNRRIDVYEPGGTHLLTLTPSLDSLERIDNIRIWDPRFKTEAGIGLESTFGEIEKAYEIRKIVNSLNNILVLVKEHPVYFTFSREELPAALRYTDTPIEAVQIPDGARIKYMMVGWE
jgi:hypothetical protein